MTRRQQKMKWPTALVRLRKPPRARTQAPGCQPFPIALGLGPVQWECLPVWWITEDVGFRLRRRPVGIRPCVPVPHRPLPMEERPPEIQQMGFSRLSCLSAWRTALARHTAFRVPSLHVPTCHRTLRTLPLPSTPPPVTATTPTGPQEPRWRRSPAPRRPNSKSCS